MGSFFEETKHGGANEVRLYGDHDVRIHVALPKASAGDLGLAVLEGESYVVKAGTIYPANDATAIGVVAADVDVSKSDVNAALILHGIINSANLPTQPSADAKAALKLIMFVNP